MFTAPELVESEPIEVLSEVDIPLKHQRRVFTCGVVRSEKRTETNS